METLEWGFENIRGIARELLRAKGSTLAVVEHPGSVSKRMKCVSNTH
jgi:hypothetical protein